MITVYGFGRVNSFVIGYTRDLRVLWALEELGLDYRVHGCDHDAKELDTPEHVARSPFHQLPVVDDDGFVLPESGADVLYLAELGGQIRAADPKYRYQVTRWCFAALTTIEPPLALLATLGDDAPGRDGLLTWVERVMTNLETWLEKHQYLTGHEFSVADILLTTVLRMANGKQLLEPYPRIVAYKAACEARPAWQRALDKYEQRLGVEQGFARRPQGIGK